MLNLSYCLRCCMPSTQEGQELDEAGFCNVCRSAEDKIRIDWKKRHSDLTEILERFREENKNKQYDCLIPISGGKDSVYQLHILIKEFGMRPLAVTFSHNWYSATGMLNLLNCLETFDIDHIMFTPKRSQVNNLAKKSLSAIGDACWHCHAGIGAFPLKVAKDFGINLVVWGESVAESSSRGTYSKPLMKFDQDYFLKVSAKVKPEVMADEITPLNELETYKTPTSEEYKDSNIFGIHLGDYIFGMKNGKPSSL